MRVLFPFSFVALTALFLVAPAHAQQNKISVYMDQFKIIRTLGGGVSCDMYFHIFNSTEYKMDRVSIKLDWGTMKTRLSFSKLEPAGVDEKHYHLVGKGCETMGGSPLVEITSCKLKKEVEGEMQKEDEDICKEMVSYQ
ncbi:MAG: hypothetical protein KAJ75_09510 [Alphaproteobacteria bacterium]|nr:hypothetical protein [Alphaproteobacteria bacterium]